MNAGRWRSAVILAVGFLLTVITAQFEAPLVFDFYRNPLPEFRNFMANSYFEGRPFGGSDIGVSIAILTFITWIMIQKRKAPESQIYLPKLKFLWMSALLTALLAVHSLKWLISRARPKVILNDLGSDAITQMTWPGFMPWDGPRGIDWNSFPSGHTASCAIMIAYAYLLWPKHRLVGVITFLGVALYSGLMGVARSMAGMHWLSDSVASFFLAWAIIDVTARRVLSSKP